MGSGSGVFLGPHTPAFFFCSLKDAQFDGECVFKNDYLEAMKGFFSFRVVEFVY